MIGAPRMPTVEIPPDTEERFATARLIAWGKKPANPSADTAGERCIVVVTPGRTFAILRCPRANAMPPNAVQALEKIAPSARPLNVAVVAYLQIDPLLEKQLTTNPVVGLIIGLGYIGHNVIVFEGHPSAFNAGCRDADMLIVDESMIPHLQKGWEHAAWTVMRGSDILVCGRNGALKRLVKGSTT